MSRDICSHCGACGCQDCWRDGKCICCENEQRISAPDDIDLVLEEKEGEKCL